MSKWYQRLAQNYQQHDRYRNWQNKTDDERYASVLYPTLSSKDDQDTMKEIARSEGRKSPQQSKLLSHRERAAASPLGGVAKQTRP
jgi:hypothetical protein